ncbi:MAG: radical SAM protein [Deltaproteobacteria bacterium]
MILPFHSLSGEPFLYDSFTNRILAVSETLHGELTRASGLVSGIMDPVVRMACIQAGLRDGEPGIDSPEDLRQSMALSGLGLSKLVLGLTHQCNLRCRYCIYGGSVPGERTHEQAAMSLETARRVLEQLRARSQVPRSVIFYGGEPLLNWDVLRFFVETFDLPGGAERIAMATNGLLLDDPDRLSFLVAHRVLLNVSLDGPGHDRMRVTPSGEGTLARLLKVLGTIRQAHPDYYSESVGFVATVTPFTRLLETAEFFNSDELFAGKVIVSSWVFDPAGALGSKEELEGEKSRQNAEWELLRRSYPRNYGRGLPFDDGLHLQKMLAIDQRPIPPHPRYLSTPAVTPV